LPAILVAADGRQPASPPPGLDAAILLRATDLATLIDAATSAASPPAVDLDSVRGLGADEAAIEFLRRRLGIQIVLTRRPATAAGFAALGGLALLSVLAFDSTGLARSLAAHPRSERVGTVVSPGLVLSHMTPSELALLPAPVVAYGLLGTPGDVTACLARGDAVVVNAQLAAELAAAQRRGGRDGVNSHSE
jgi:glycerol-3-phosphate responsive antiterminator